MSRREWSALAATGLLLSLILAFTADLPKTRAHEPSGLLFVLTGNERGFIRPCGCSKPALGGVHRRATYLTSLKEKGEAPIPVSGGNLVVQGGLQQQMKFESFLMAMGEMGYRALAPGPGEFLLGLEALEGAQHLAPFPFVAFNVTKDGAPLFVPTHRLDDVGWVVSGLLPPLPQVKEVSVTDAVVALPKLLETLGAKDRLLLFFSGDEPEAARLAKAVPKDFVSRVVLVLGGNYDGPTRLDALAPLRVMSVGSKGRAVALVRPDVFGANAFEGVVLREELQGAEGVNQILDGYRESLRERDLLARVPKAPNGIAYAGESTCVECHEPTCKFLDTTPHERAWATLVATRDHHDPECVECHVTGYAQAQGFESFEKTPTLINVTCEACHGPGEEHNNLQTKTPGGKVTKTTCVRCHDPDNSPQFDFDKYWPKIAHPPTPK